MKLLELILLITAYSSLILAIFVSTICYRRNLENWETIVFTLSLLILIVAITASSFTEMNEATETTSVSILVAMVLVSLTTPLSVLVERKHNIAAIWKKGLIAFSLTALCAIALAHFLGKLEFVEYPIVIFLVLSVASSMVFVRLTKPKKKVEHLEKANRNFAIVFLVVLPIYLVAYYVFTDVGYQLKVGFTLPLVFILLAVTKIYDDLHRLSLVKLDTNVNEQHFKNYGLSEREKEVASLLAKGKTNKQISEELYISIPTVKTHSSNIYRKCGVGNRHQLSVLLSN